MNHKHHNIIEEVLVISKVFSESPSEVIFFLKQRIQLTKCKKCKFMLEKTYEILKLENLIR